MLLLPLRPAAVQYPIQPRLLHHQEVLQGPLQALPLQTLLLALLVLRPVLRLMKLQVQVPRLLLKSYRLQT